MLIDDVTIKVTAGHGGSGVIAFAKNRFEKGPTGGDGGNGGDIYFEGVSDLGALTQFRFKKKIRAEDGTEGGTNQRKGADSPPLFLKVPVGTVIRKVGIEPAEEITKVGEKILIAKGGKGGWGNYNYRSSINTTPRKFKPGLPGEEFTVRLEMKLIADVGLIGLPSAGKSSLLNSLTDAKSKVGSYPFTTLEPYLGDYYGLIIADIPGLIAGASSGKGLGTKFLRHIERTKVLFHLVSAESDTPKKDYETIRGELKAHNPNLLAKDEYLLLSKTDLVDSEAIARKIKTLKELNPNVLPISVIDDKSLETVKTLLNKIYKEKTE